MQIFIILLISAQVLYFAKKDYATGLSHGIFYLVWLPHSLRIETAGLFPEFTVHRIIIIILLIAALLQNRLQGMAKNTPLLMLFVITFSSHTVSMMFSIEFSLSLKRLFATVFENYLLFILITSSIRGGSNALDFAKAAVVGLGVAALISFLEYYGRINIISILIPEHFQFDASGVVAGFQHPIHLGYAMAMIFPVALILLSHSGSKLSSFRYFLLMVFSVSSCYFSHRRGPWVGAIIAGIMIFFLGNKRIKRICYILGIVICLAIMVRPGIRDTIVPRLYSIFPHGGVQEPSAEYRKILWYVAFDKTNASPTRFLFGYGGLSTELMDISMYFDRQRGGQVMAQGFSSWDSAWAAQLVQYGWVGLALEAILQITIYVKVLNAYKRVQKAEVKSLLAGVLSGCMVFTWGMLTVAMFSPQLVYLFWTLAGAGIITGLDSKGLSKRV